MERAHSVHCKKGNKRLWFLRRLSKLGASIETLVEMFQLSIRNLMEQGAPVFTGGLSQGNMNQDTLEERRIVISLKFAKKSINHPKLKHFFKRNTNDRTRFGRKFKFIEPRVNSDRGRKGPISFLIRLLNENNA